MVEEPIHNLLFVGSNLYDFKYRKTLFYRVGIGQHCNFKVLEFKPDDIIKPVKITQGVYHYALVPRNVSLSIHCEGQPHEIDNIRLNGYIKVAKQCVSSFGQHQMKNIQHFSIANKTMISESAPINITEITVIKNFFVNKTLNRNNDGELESNLQLIND